MSNTFENAKKGGFVIKPKGHDEYMVYLDMTGRVRTLGEQPIDWGDVDCIRNRVADYFAIMQETNCRPTVSGLAMAFGLRRQRLCEIKNGTYRKGGKYKELTEEGIEEIRKAYDMLEVLYESYVMHDDMNPMTAVFMGTNLYGYRNASQVDVNTPAIDADKEPTAREIQDKYRDVIGSLPSDTQDNGEDD